MTLSSSGAALYAGSVAEFIKAAHESNLTAHLQREFNRRWGGVSESEVRAWRSSLTSLAHVVRHFDIEASAVGIEVKLPLTSRRIDASFVGRSPSGQPSVALVELKQWDTAEASVFPDNVVCGGFEHLHPSVQASAYVDYLRDSHSAFTERGFAIRGCSYLHNMPRVEGAGILGAQYANALRDAPLFTRDDADHLGDFLMDAVSGGDGLDLLPDVVLGRYSPSKSLLIGIADALQGSTVWQLLDEQRLAFNFVRGYVDQASKRKAVVIVTGGPGTGKSVIAAHLLVTLGIEGGRSVVHATGSKAFTTNLRAIAPNANSATAVFRYFNNFNPHETSSSAFDVIICDEAHRLRKSSNGRFTPRRLKSQLSQTEEIIRAARVSVFFLDERQNVRPDESGTVEAIREAGVELDADVCEISLSDQFRCNGSTAYMQWVNDLMSEAPRSAGAWANGEYEFSVYDDVRAMERDLREYVQIGNSGRVVAGFCWPWSEPHANGSLANDVVIGTWRRPWNEKPPEQRKAQRPAPRANRHPYYLWATQPERIGEVGCIYSVQGFEFDYCAVILADDLVWRTGMGGWIGRREASHDPAIKRRNLGPESLRQLLWHTYRVLLTRGMKGTLVFSTDHETQQHLRALLA